MVLWQLRGPSIGQLSASWVEVRLEWKRDAVDECGLTWMGAWVRDPRPIARRMVGMEGMAVGGLGCFDGTLQLWGGKLKD